MWNNLTPDEMTAIVQDFDWLHANAGEEFTMWLFETLILWDMGF